MDRRLDKSRYGNTETQVINPSISPPLPPYPHMLPGHALLGGLSILCPPVSLSLPLHSPPPPFPLFRIHACWHIKHINECTHWDNCFSRTVARTFPRVRPEDTSEILTRCAENGFAIGQARSSLRHLHLLACSVVCLVCLMLFERASERARERERWREKARQRAWVIPIVLRG
jgi:hypothetical protein